MNFRTSVLEFATSKPNAPQALESNRAQTVTPLIFIQLNEVNFDLVRHYVEKYDDLPAFGQLLSTFHTTETFGEQRYEELEPWIQWVSAHTGLNFSQHRVFRLGDIVKTPDSVEQIFEKLERRGLKVGAISPMNARNRLRKPSYFIPDPWTDTPPDDSGFSRRLSKMLRQAVNDNASGRLSMESVLTIMEAILRSLDIRRSTRLFHQVAMAFSKPWTKALVLDMLIHLVHRRLWLSKRPDVSFVFLNAGAHLQHHYFFNSGVLDRTGESNPDWYISQKADPIRDMLQSYDCILADYLSLARRGVRILLATGLTQVPYDRVKYYYRLTDHAQFLQRAGIRFMKVHPRMTRDFEIVFDNARDATFAVEELESLRLERTGQRLFSEIEVRKESLFVTLTYPQEIRTNDCAVGRNGRRMDDFGKMVSFVAIKNGMHSTKGFLFLSPDSRVPLPEAPVPVTYLHDLVLRLTTLNPANP